MAVGDWNPEIVKQSTEPFPMTPLQTRLAQADKPVERTRTMASDLIERLEAAPANERGLFEEAFRARFPEVTAGAWGAISAWDQLYDRFTTMLDAGAYESAVLMLVPEGWTDFVRIFIKPEATAVFMGNVEACAFTPALALTIACLKARGL